MGTAMIELIEYIESNEIVYNKDLILKLKELLEKEKKQILAAYNNGSQDMALEEKYEPFEYYNQTYGK